MMRDYYLKRFLKSFSFLLLFLAIFPIGNELKAQGIEGKEFYLTFLPNRLVRSGSTLVPDPSSEIQITIIASEFTDVEIIVPHINYSKTITLVANESDRVTFKSSQFGYHEFGLEKNDPIIIKSENKVSVFAIHYMRASSDGTMFLPINSLGNNYIINSIDDVSVYRHQNINIPNHVRSNERYQFKILSIKDNNKIRITTGITDIDALLSIGQNEITLNKGESIVYQFASSPDGIEISSDEPILVLSGIQDAQLPRERCCPDHIFHLEYPIDFLKNQYLIIPLEGRNKFYDYFNITSLADNNDIELNGNVIASLNKSNNYSNILSSPAYIESEYEISVSQYAAGSNNFGGNFGDPFKIQLLPIDQMCDDIRYSLIKSDNITHYYGIFVKYKNDDCTLNGVLLSDFNDIVGTEFQYKYVKQQVGTYRVQSKKGAMVLGYGFGTFDSYGYMAGACFEKIDPKFYINDSLSKSIICFDEGLTIRAESESDIESLDWTVNDTLNLTGNPADFSMLTEPGFYNIKLVLNNNEKQVSFYEIQRLQDIQIDLVDSLLVCKDEIYEIEANIIGDGSMTYTWTPNDNLLNSNGYKVRLKESVTEEITLYLDVISEYGCTQSDSIKLIPVHKIDLNIPDEITICRNDIISQIDFQNVNYQYFDSDGNLYYDSNVFSNDLLHETMIIIEQMNGNCFFYDTTMIYINELPEIDTKNFPIAACPDTWRDYEVPQDNNLRINWKVTNGQIIDSYDAESLSNDSTNLINGTKARILWETPGTGTIEMEILDLTTNCSNTVTEYIPINNLLNPTIKANGILVYDTVTVCFGEEMKLDAGVDFDDYFWYKEIFDQNGTPYSTDREISIDQEGLYIINVYNELACIGLDSIYVRIYDLPNISAGNDTSICYSTNTTLKATGGTSYKWYIDGKLVSEADTVLFDYTISNSLELVGIDDNGCVNYDTVNVEVFDEVEIKLIDEYFICENELLTIDNLEVLGVSGVKEVNWTSKNPLNEITGLSNNQAEIKAVENGSYSVEIVDNNACIHNASFDVYIQKISTEINFSPEVCFDETQVISSKIINKVVNQKRNSIALVLDVSKDMNPQNMYLSKLGAKSFLDLLDKDRVEVCLITFDEYVYLEQEFTNDFSLLKDKIDNLKQNSGSNFESALLNYTISAIPYIKENAQFEVRDIVFFTGSNSTINSSQVISDCKDNNITFHSMLVGNLENTTLQSISDQTGGTYLPNITDQNDVINKYRDVFNSTIVNPFTYKWTSNEIDLSSETGDRLVLFDYKDELRNVTIDLLVTDTITNCFHDTTISFKINPLPTFNLSALNDVCIGDTAIYKLTIDSLYDEYSILWVESDTGPLIIDENDSTIIRFVKSVSNRFSVEINDSVSCVASKEFEYFSARTQVSFQIDDIISSPKVFNQKVRINTSVDSVRCISDESFKLYISLNSKIFNPIVIESNGKDLLMTKEFNLSDSKWLISVELSPDDIINNELYIIGDAILADAYSYPIEIDSAVYNLITTDVETFNGSVTLDEICEEGETRLLDYSNFFNILNSFPNPTTDNINVSIITSDEEAKVVVECSDYIGREFSIPYSISDSYFTGEFLRFTVNANLDGLNSGIYRISISNGKYNKSIKVVKK